MKTQEENSQREREDEERKEKNWRAPGLESSRLGDAQDKKRHATVTTTCIDEDNQMFEHDEVSWLEGSDCVAEEERNTSRPSKRGGQAHHCAAGERGRRRRAASSRPEPETWEREVAIDGSKRSRSMPAHVFIGDKKWPNPIGRANKPRAKDDGDIAYHKDADRTGVDDGDARCHDHVDSRLEKKFERVEMKIEQTMKTIVTHDEDDNEGKGGRPKDQCDDEDDSSLARPTSCANNRRNCGAHRQRKVRPSN